MHGAWLIAKKHHVWRRETSHFPIQIFTLSSGKPVKLPRYQENEELHAHRVEVSKTIHEDLKLGISNPSSQSSIYKH